MKRNMVPLLGIAFVAAIVATGVVYGLFGGRLRAKAPELAGQSIVVAARDLDRGTVIKPEDLQVSQVKGALKGSYSKVDEAVGATLLEAVQKNEPLLEGRVASLDPKGTGAGGGIAAGMRAVSIRVAESSGVMGLLHSGSRVDLQAVSERNGPAELRTILQNVEVLRVNPQLEPTNNSRFPVPVATLLVPVQYADIVALADTGARLRVTVRNPLDEGSGTRHVLGLAAVFNSAAVSEPQRAQTQAPGNDSLDHAVELKVQVLGASAAALGQLDSNLVGLSGHDSAAHDSMRVAAFRTDTNAQELVRKLEQAQELDVVSSSMLTASVGRPVSVRASAAPYRLRVQFSPATDALGKVSLRVQPEVSLRNGAGVESRRYDADLPDGASFLVRGLLQAENNAGILGRLYPGHSWSGRELVIYVTSKSHGQAPSRAVAETSKGQ
ncbi:MAG TPA: Flp pilus assembly protein CpaB [Bryobacteraceae bacterium]|jgi:Flp pilus assembly protein CpaB|nr:Flp pilus assembly protein CpaB [Bryobacteraceae bacterium]